MRPHNSARGLGTPRRAVLVLLVAAGAVVFLYLVAFVAAGSGVARGATVLGVDIGGQTTEEATATLQRELKDEVRAPIPVRASDSDATAKVRPARAGLALDVEATVEAARARTWNPISLVGRLVDAGAIDPVVTVDRPALRAAVDRVADKVDREKVEGSVRFGAAGVPKPVAPVEGVALSRKKAVDRLTEAYLTTYLEDGKPVSLPSKVRAPDVSRAEVQRVTEEVAVPATASDVTVTVEGTQVALSPREIATALTFEPDGKGSLKLVVDPAQLHAAVAQELAPVEEPARRRDVPDQERIAQGGAGRRPVARCCPRRSPPRSSPCWRCPARPGQSPSRWRTSSPRSPPRWPRGSGSPRRSRPTRRTTRRTSRRA